MIGNARDVHEGIAGLERHGLVVGRGLRIGRRRAVRYVAAVGVVADGIFLRLPDGVKRGHIGTHGTGLVVPQRAVGNGVALLVGRRGAFRAERPAEEDVARAGRLGKGERHARVVFDVGLIRGRAGAAVGVIMQGIRLLRPLGVNRGVRGDRGGRVERGGVGGIGIPAAEGPALARGIGGHGDRAVGPDRVEHRRAGGAEILVLIRRAGSVGVVERRAGGIAGGSGLAFIPVGKRRVNVSHKVGGRAVLIPEGDLRNLDEGIVRLQRDAAVVGRGLIHGGRRAGGHVAAVGVISNGIGLGRPLGVNVHVRGDRRGRGERVLEGAVVRIPAVEIITGLRNGGRRREGRAVLHVQMLRSAGGHRTAVHVIPDVILVDDAGDHDVLGLADIRNGIGVSARRRRRQRGAVYRYGIGIIARDRRHGEGEAAVIVHGIDVGLAGLRRSGGRVIRVRRRHGDVAGQNLPLRIERSRRGKREDLRVGKGMVLIESRPAAVGVGIPADKPITGLFIIFGAVVGRGVRSAVGRGLRRRCGDARFQRTAVSGEIGDRDALCVPFRFQRDIRRRRIGCAAVADLGGTRIPTAQRVTGLRRIGQRYSRIRPLGEEVDNGAVCRGEVLSALSVGIDHIAGRGGRPAVEGRRCRYG